MRDRFGIWLFALGYFACYVPFSAMTKALSKGLFDGMEGPINGFRLLPLSVVASFVGAMLFLYLSGWYKAAGQKKFGRFSVPAPGRWTFLSGLCTSSIIVTTTLAYTFEGVSIVFVMLLMRGGVLCIAPVVDTLSGRKVRWFSFVGLGLSASALIVAFFEKGGFGLSLICTIDVVLYVLSYFVRLRFMSRLAKSADTASNKRYFVEEQLVATPFLLLFLLLFAWIGQGDIAAQIRAGFFGLFGSGVVLEILLVGFLSQGVGLFGGLILLDKSENTYCVPLNRCSSIMAGVMASYALAIVFGQTSLSVYKLVGASLIVCAMLFLTIPSLLEKKRGVVGQAKTIGS